MAKAVGEDGCVDNLIIGSSFAAFATAMALRERGAAFEVIDVGYDLEPERAEEVSELARTPPPDWRADLTTKLFPPAEATFKGVKRRLIFGSDFPYRIPSPLNVSTETCETEFSHALGGFGNVWGAAMMPYTAHDLRAWPVAEAELAQSYRNVLKYVPLSAEKDDLARHFPLHTDEAKPLDRSAQADALLDGLERQRGRLANAGAVFGRARVAVNANGGANACRACGRCLDGCPYNAIFNPRRGWAELPEGEGRVHRGYYALEFEERDDCVEVAALDIKCGAVRRWRAKRVYLALGHVGTTRMIARSLKRFAEPIRALDSQYYFFPLFSYGSHKREDIRYTLGEAFLEINNAGISEHTQHLQIYGWNHIFEKTLASIVPAGVLRSPLIGRFYLFQGYLHSADSGALDIELVRSDERSDEVIVRGRPSERAKRTAQRVQTLIARALRSFGLAPPASLSIAPVGRSFHAGGSFPMGGAHPVYASDTLGRPAGLKRVHIADPASFPSIPSSTIAFSIMANADRIARSSARLED